MRKAYIECCLMFKPPSLTVRCQEWNTQRIEWPSSTLSIDREAGTNLTRMSSDHVFHSLTKPSTVEPSRDEVDQQLCIEADGSSFGDLWDEYGKLLHEAIEELGALLKGIHVLSMPRKLVQSTDHTFERTLEAFDREWRLL